MSTEVCTVVITLRVMRAYTAIITRSVMPTEVYNVVITLRVMQPYIIRRLQDSAQKALLNEA